MQSENFRWIRELPERRTPIVTLIDDLLQVRAKEWPKKWHGKPANTPDWNALHVLDYGGELERLTAWIDALFTDTPPPAARCERNCSAPRKAAKYLLASTLG